MRSGSSRERRLAWSIVRAVVRAALLDETPPGYESLVEALRDLHRAFPDKPRSWFFRAVYRVVKGTVERRRGYWIVKGLEELGDTKPAYLVTIGKSGKYYCSCFAGMYGAVRQKHICTHIAAVMLHRRQRRLTEFSSFY